MEHTYWETFYGSPDESITRASPFAKHVDSHVDPQSRILDLGCGNCRDSIYFASQGHTVTAVDTAVDDATDGSLTRIKGDVLRYVQTSREIYDVIYMRWFLHALPVHLQYDVVRAASALLRKGGSIWIENRSINDNILLAHSTYDEEDGSYSTSHKRWPTSQEQLRDMLDSSGVTVVSMEESRGFSPSGVRDYNTDPLLFRIQAIRNEEFTTRSD